MSVAEMLQSKLDETQAALATAEARLADARAALAAERQAREQAERERDEVTRWESGDGLLALRALRAALLALDVDDPDDPAYSDPEEIVALLVRERVEAEAHEIAVAQERDEARQELATAEAKITRIMEGGPRVLAEILDGHGPIGDIAWLVAEKEQAEASFQEQVRITGEQTRRAEAAERERDDMKLALERLLTGPTSERANRTEEAERRVAELERELERERNGAATLGRMVDRACEQAHEQTAWAEKLEARVAELEASVQNGRELLESAMTGLDEVHARRAELEEHLLATRSEYLRTARAGGCIAAGIVIAVEDILAAVGSPVNDPLPRTVSAAEAESRLAAALEG